MSTKTKTFDFTIASNKPFTPKIGLDRNFEADPLHYDEMKTILKGKHGWDQECLLAHFISAYIAQTWGLERYGNFVFNQMNAGLVDFERKHPLEETPRKILGKIRPAFYGIAHEYRGREGHVLFSGRNDVPGMVDLFNSIPDELRTGKQFKGASGHPFYKKLYNDSCWLLWPSWETIARLLRERREQSTKKTYWTVAGELLEEIRDSELQPLAEKPKPDATPESIALMEEILELRREVRDLGVELRNLKGGRRPGLLETPAGIYLLDELVGRGRR